LETFEQPSLPFVDQRQAAFARLVSRVLETLNGAVEKRIAGGLSQNEIAEKIGCHKSALSRILNGRSKNVTLKTISDILWATDFEPRDFSADPLEDISPNVRKFSDIDMSSSSAIIETKIYRFDTVMNMDGLEAWENAMVFTSKKTMALSQ
jgi:transcriptional regulator with XRE-family HTH domain